MQYSVAHFDYSFGEEWEQDIFLQALGDLGFDTFDEADAYIRTELLDEEALRRLVGETSGVQLIGIEACADENWNATWEAEHPVMDLPLGVRIIPHCAFGAGYHETTGMMIDALLAHDLKGAHVLDNGSGTGVLGIMAAKQGAASVIAVDIDDKSVESTRMNAELNQVEIDAHLGDTPINGRYNLILSNIHRNILLTQMPLYAAYLEHNGELWLSGFYEEDVPVLSQAAQAAGLRLIDHQNRGEWQMLRLQK